MVKSKLSTFKTAQFLCILATLFISAGASATSCPKRILFRIKGFELSSALDRLSQQQRADLKMQSVYEIDPKSAEDFRKLFDSDYSYLGDVKLIKQGLECVYQTNSNETDPQVRITLAGNSKTTNVATIRFQPFPTTINKTIETRVRMPVKKSVGLYKNVGAQSNIYSTKDGTYNLYGPAGKITKISLQIFK